MAGIVITVSIPAPEIHPIGLWRERFTRIGSPHAVPIGKIEMDQPCLRARLFLRHL
jgi:hypothetical protein